MKHAAATILIAVASLAATAQPDQRPLAGPSVAPSETEPSAEKARRAIEARLTTLDEQREQLQRALERVESGEEVDLRDLMGPHREGHREGRRERFRDQLEGRLRDRPQDRAPITAEQRAQIRAFMQKHDPQMLQRLDRFQQERPEAAQRMFDRHAHRAIEMIELEEEDPDAFRTRLRAMQSFGKIREVVTDAIARDALETSETRAALRELVALRLDDEESRHEREIEELDARLTDLRAKLAKDRDTRDERIDHAVDRIIKRAADFRDRAPE